MRLSTRGKYGLYAMYYLALHQGEGPQTLHSISSMGVSEQYLEQLLGSLRRGGLVRATRGAGGGYELARPAGDITLLDIVDAMEGPVEMSACTIPGQNCEKADTCPVRWVWRQTTDAINAELRKIILSDMLDRETKREEPLHE